MAHAVRCTATHGSYHEDVMGTVISLSTPELDWEVLVRTVERTGAPLWLELNGTIQGVLLPAANAQRLLGRYVAHEAQPEPAADPAQPVERAIVDKGCS